MEHKQLQYHFILCHVVKTNSDLNELAIGLFIFFIYSSL